MAYDAKAYPPQYQATPPQYEAPPPAYQAPPPYPYPDRQMPQSTAYSSQSALIYPSPQPTTVHYPAPPTPVVIPVPAPPATSVVQTATLTCARALGRGRGRKSQAVVTDVTGGHVYVVNQRTNVNGRRSRTVIQEVGGPGRTVVKTTPRGTVIKQKF